MRAMSEYDKNKWSAVDGVAARVVEHCYAILLILIGTFTLSARIEYLLI